MENSVDGFIDEKIIENLEYITKSLKDNTDSACQVITSISKLIVARRTEVELLRARNIHLEEEIKNLKDRIGDMEYEAKPDCVTCDNKARNGSVQCDRCLSRKGQ